MKKLYVFSVLILLTILIFGNVGDTVKIKVQKTRLLSKPDFLSSTIIYLENGEPLEIIKESGSWLFVKTSGKIKGYIHKSSVAKRKTSLTGLIPGQKGASKEEIALAAKGFNEDAEKKIKTKTGSYNFKDMEWLMKQKVSISRLKKFVKEGRLK
jgi:hypothetical protein